MFAALQHKLATIGFVVALAAGSVSLAACGAATGGGSAAGGATAATSADTAAVTSAATSADTTAGTQAVSAGSGSGQAAFRARMQGTLDPLVSQGTLTAGQESAVLDALTPRPATSTSRTRTFTSRTGTAGGSRNAGGRPGGQGAFQKTALDRLVQQGTITAAQETAILSALPQPAPRPTATPTVQG